MYHYTDADGVPQILDGSQAIFEHAMGHQLEFATPRYTDVIAMNPAAYDWLPQGDAGVWEKWLGSFTERNLRIGFLRLDAGAVYQAGQHPSIEILFQINGQVSRGRREVRPRDRIRIPGQRRPRARRGHRTHRIPPHSPAHLLSQHRNNGAPRGDPAPVAPRPPAKAPPVRLWGQSFSSQRRHRAA